MKNDQERICFWSVLLVLACDQFLLKAGRELLVLDDVMPSLFVNVGALRPPFPTPSMCRTMRHIHKVASASTSQILNVT